MTYIFHFILVILSVDIISGIFHWIEDAYGNPNWVLLGKYVIIPNLEHHLTPRSFLKRSYWSRNDISIYITSGIFLVCYWIGYMNWEFALFLLLISQINEFHALSHQPDCAINKITRIARKIGIIQSNNHHGKHHTAPFDCNYCILTSYLNPILTYLKIWDHFEKLLSRIGIKPLRGTEIREFI